MSQQGYLWAVVGVNRVGKRAAVSVFGPYASRGDACDVRDRLRVDDPKHHYNVRPVQSKESVRELARIIKASRRVR